MTMTNCPTDETVAAFLDGRLHPEARAEVVEHIANCPDCYALVSAGWDYQAVEQKTQSDPAPVVEGHFGSWWMWTAAAVAASAMIVFALPTTRNTMAFWRGRSVLIAAQNAEKERPVEGRLYGFGYQPATRIVRGGEEEKDNYAVQAAALDLMGRDARSGHQWQALSAAHLLIGERKEAIDAIEKAALLSPDDPSILNDRIVAYLAQGEAQRALEAANRAWQVAQTPEIAFNRALAFKANQREKEAIAAWQEYLKLDATSPWAEEAKGKLQQLQEPY
jgi:tetratricopeptide (TPR) repeat protein